MSERYTTSRKSRRSERYLVKKDQEPTQYDPQIGQAAAQNAQTAAAAQGFSQEFYEKNITPLLQQMVTSSSDTQGKLGRLYDMNYTNAQEANDRYKQFGIPAEQKYYDMVARFSEPDEQNRQAGLALGDVRTAAAGQRATMMRQLGARGINPTSPAAISTMGDMGVQNTAIEAGAMNRARLAAKTLGMQLTSDAANFGRGGASSTLAFGQAAGGNAAGSFGVAQGALGGASGAAAVPMQGYGLAMQGYSQNLNAYTQLGVEDMRQQSAADQGLGNFLGTALGVGASMFKFSDLRLKRDLVPVGMLTNGVTVYEYSYIWGGLRERGVLADELEQVMPEAVVTHPNGYKMVNYGMVQCG